MLWSVPMRSSWNKWVSLPEFLKPFVLMCKHSIIATWCPSNVLNVFNWSDPNHVFKEKMNSIQLKLKLSLQLSCKIYSPISGLSSILCLSIKCFIFLFFLLIRFVLVLKKRKLKLWKKITGSEGKYYFPFFCTFHKVIAHI